MFGLQMAVAFLAWIGYGVVQARRRDKVRAFVGRLPRTRRGLIAAGLFLLAVIVLFGGIGAVFAVGGSTPAGLALWAWGAVTLVGLLFVHLNTLALAILVLLAQESVTVGRSSASSTSENEKSA